MKFYFGNKWRQCLKRSWGVQGLKCDYNNQNENNNLNKIVCFQLNKIKFTNIHQRKNSTCRAMLLHLFLQINDSEGQRWDLPKCYQEHNFTRYLKKKKKILEMRLKWRWQHSWIMQKSTSLRECFRIFVLCQTWKGQNNRTVANIFTIWRVKQEL